MDAVEMQAAVPLSYYDDVRPWVDRRIVAFLAAVGI
jgi:hypothetical protein